MPVELRRISVVTESVKGGGGSTPTFSLVLSDSISDSLDDSDSPFNLKGSGTGPGVASRVRISWEAELPAGPKSGVD